MGRGASLTPFGVPLPWRLGSGGPGKTEEFGAWSLILAVLEIHSVSSVLCKIVQLIGANSSFWRSPLDLLGPGIRHDSAGAPGEG